MKRVDGVLADHGPSGQAAATAARRRTIVPGLRRDRRRAAGTPSGSASPRRQRGAPRAGPGPGAARCTVLGRRAGCACAARRRAPAPRRWRTAWARSRHHRRGNRTPVVHGVERGEEEHRGVLTLGAQRLADVAPVGVGEPDVDHQDVEAGADREVAQRLLAVARDDHLVTVHPERVGEHATHRLVVLADPDPGHSSILPHAAALLPPRRRRDRRTWSGTDQVLRRSARIMTTDLCSAADTRRRASPGPASSPGPAAVRLRPPGRPGGRARRGPGPAPVPGRPARSRTRRASSSSGQQWQLRWYRRSTAATGWTAPRCWSPSSGCASELGGRGPAAADRAAWPRP